VKLKYFVAALGLTVGLLGCLAGNAVADGIPSGWTCSGNCGSSGADGVVPLSPIGSASYQWVSTNNGVNGVGIVPGTGLPNPLATLTPSNVPIAGGGPSWSPLGGDSGACYDTGCGYSGWVNSNYVIPGAGNYYLGVGVVNWTDTLFQSGLALDGVTVGGVPVGPGEPPPTGTPEPGSLLLLTAGVPALLLLKRLS